MKIMINKDEILFKINTVIKYLKEHNGYVYKLYNHLCPGYGEPDSNIVEYAENTLAIVQELINIIDNK